MERTCAVIEASAPEAVSAGALLTFDKILQEIGEFGFYQVTNAVLTSVALIFTAFSLFNFVFSAGIPEHR